MPHRNHKKYPYVEKLIKEKDIAGLEKEKDILERIVNQYNQQRIDCFDKGDKLGECERTEKIKEQEEALLRYIEEKLDELLNR